MIKNKVEKALPGGLELALCPHSKLIGMYSKLSSPNSLNFFFLLSSKPREASGPLLHCPFWWSLPHVVTEHMKDGLNCKIHMNSKLSMKKV